MHKSVKYKLRIGCLLIIYAVITILFLFLGLSAGIIFFFLHRNNKQLEHELRKEKDQHIIWIRRAQDEQDRQKQLDAEELEKIISQHKEQVRLLQENISELKNLVANLQDVTRSTPDSAADATSAQTTEVYPQDKKKNDDAWHASKWLPWNWF